LLVSSATQRSTRFSPELDVGLSPVPGLGLPFRG
jgi:hypothetical protein